jgi:uroporphyrinogen-III synthase
VKEDIFELRYFPKIISLEQIFERVEALGEEKNLALVAACIGGAATIEETKKMLEETGFENIFIKPNEKSRELIRQWDPGRSENAAEYVVSAYIEAIKPA